VKGLDISFDYYDSVTHNFFGSISEQTIIQSVEDLGPASPYNSLVHFGNISGPIPTAPGQVSEHPSHSVWIFDSEINVGATAIKGWDATVNYTLPTTEFGKFDLTSQITFYNSYLYQAIPSENYYQYAGTATQNEGTTPRYRTYTTLDWRYHSLKLVTGNTFIPSVEDIGTGGSTASAPAHVGSYIQEDFAASYQFGNALFNGAFKGLTITAESTMRSIGTFRRPTTRFRTPTATLESTTARSDASIT
jgi:iron complex outermembrane receptor protein